MDLKDYLMDELWPLLTDEQRQRLIDVAFVLAQYAPPPKDGESDADKDD